MQITNCGDGCQTINSLNGRADNNSLIASHQLDIHRGKRDLNRYADEEEMNGLGTDGNKGMNNILG